MLTRRFPLQWMVRPAPTCPSAETVANLMPRTLHTASSGNTVSMDLGSGSSIRKKVAPVAPPSSVHTPSPGGPVLAASLQLLCVAVVVVRR